MDPKIRQMERLGARSWPAEVIEPLWGWRLSIDRGVTRRANSVLPEAWDDGPAVEDRIAAVEHRYRQAGLDPCFKMTRAALPGDLDDRLGRRGYRPEGHSVVFTMPAGRLADRSSVPVELATDLSPDWVACSWPTGTANSEVESRCRIIERVSQPKAFALARVEGQPVGAAMAAIRRGWGCITAVHTTAAFRRQGVARALLTVLTNWAAEQGANSLFLQVEEANSPARGLYASAGYCEAYRYHYRTLKPLTRP